MNVGPILGLLLAGSACDGADPAKGGFFAGLSALSGGCYKGRREEREQEVGERERTRDALESDRQDLEARTTAASAELDRLRGEHLELKRRIVRLNSDLAARRVQLDNRTKAGIQSALTDKPEDGGVSAEADRIRSLRAAIEDARGLVEKLSRL